MTSLPLALMGTLSTCALWCTNRELVLSLGPVPVCIFRRRFPYQDIASVTVVQGRSAVLRAVLSTGAVFWQPFGYLYGLTLGKALIDVVLEPDSTSRKALGRWGNHLLISVDEAEDIAALIEFRKQHGPEAPLPAPLAAARPRLVAGDRATWVWCDLCDLFFEPWKGQEEEDKVVCSMWDLFLQPWNQSGGTAMWQGLHERTA
eukprot:TRINITY_DN14523_c0_g1_i3.p1 TRINITY_DN14523_c0_g1~~TRINITY_DN14523_c0_g1_i3.p1  ORF type:complete len:203 (+),score=23.28 TRINITY_DN14523_c0_g1_i3:112-720(+)